MPLNTDYLQTLRQLMRFFGFQKHKLSHSVNAKMKGFDREQWWPIYETEVADDLKIFPKLH
jgi:hypothetical protein